MDTGPSGISQKAAKNRFATHLAIEPLRLARWPGKAGELGFTLAELLITVAFLAILAVTMVPNMNSADADKLDVAAAEVRNALRFARSEAMRRGQSVLFDAESSPGRIKVSGTSCTSFGTPKTVNDPRTKLSFDVDVSGGPYSGGVGLTPQFMAGGTAYGGVIFDATGAAVDACQVTGMSSKGTPQAGSGLVLSLGTRQVALALDAATGRVSGP